jgi:hypothetical protein
MGLRDSSGSTGGAAARLDAQGALRNARPDDGLRAGSVRAVIDGRFSPKAFEASEDAEALAATLREEVVLAIQPAIQAAMKAVIGQLNSLGAPPRSVTTRQRVPPSACTSATTALSAQAPGAIEPPSRLPLRRHRGTLGHAVIQFRTQLA